MMQQSLVGEGDGNFIVSVHSDDNTLIHKWKELTCRMLTVTGHPAVSRCQQAYTMLVWVTLYRSWWVTSIVFASCGICRRTINKSASLWRAIVLSTSTFHRHRCCFLHHLPITTSIRFTPQCIMGQHQRAVRHPVGLWFLQHCYS